MALLFLLGTKMSDFGKEKADVRQGTLALMVIERFFEAKAEDFS
jgi:hypothetical protein